MSSFGVNKYVSRIDQHDFDVAISKLSYEIQHRKQEFLGLCTKYDKNYKSRIDKKYFLEILNKFTVYPDEYEKNLIIYKTAINDKYIDYLNLAESPRINEEPYQHIFLQHLNDKRFQKYYQQKNILPTSATGRKNDEESDIPNIKDKKKNQKEEKKSNDEDEKVM
jgi:hypothetical protein